MTTTMETPNHQQRSSSLLGKSLSEIWRRGSQVVSVGQVVLEDAQEGNVDDYDAILGRLASKSKAFSSLSTQDVQDLCQAVMDSVQKRSQEWANAGSWLSHETRIWGLSPKSNVAQVTASEERFIFGNMVLSFLKTVKGGLEYKQGRGGGDPPALLRNVRSVPMKEGMECLAYGPVSLSGMPGHEYELWTLPKISKDSTTIQNEHDDNSKLLQEPSVTVVLGAGNQPFLGMIDALHCCFARREVVLIKHHPLRPHMIAPYEIILEPLMKRGYVYQVLDKGIPNTVEIISNPLVGHVHITGSLATDKAVRDSIAKARPSLDKSVVENMVTSELGCVTPWIIAPGKYSETELVHSARLIVTSKKGNGGCNCLSAQAVVIPKDWADKDEFKKALLVELKRQPNQPCYYPGSREKRATLKNTYDARMPKPIVVEAESVGEDNNPADNVVVVECGTPGEEGYDGAALKNEAFSPVLALVELPGEEANYLENVAVPFVNNKDVLYGSLSCSVLAPKDCDMESVARAVSTLNYGTVAVNAWSIVGYFGALGGSIWGAYPNDKTRQSGHGVVGNFYGISDPGKTVVHGPALEKKPLFDLAEKPPPIVFDSLHVLTCAPSTMTGVFNLFVLLFVRSISSVFSSFFNLVNKGGRVLRGKFH